MKRWTALFCLLALGAAGLSAQATAPVNGTLAANEERFHAFTINFGATPAAHTITVAISGNSATAGLQVFLGNLDEMAAAGAATGADSDSDTGTGTINLSVTTPMYSGTHTFVVHAAERTPGSGVTYTGTISCATLGAGAITAGATHLIPDNPPSLNVIFNRIVLTRGSADTGAVARHDVLVDFGATAQAITFWAQCDAQATGSATVQEILTSGAESALGSPLSGSGSWQAEGNRTTSSRSGNVRLRLRLQETGGSSMSYTAALVLPATVSAHPLTPITVSGNLAPNQRRIHRVTIDFGPTAVDHVLELLAATSTGNPDLTVVDRTEIVSNGTATGILGDIPWLLPADSGLRDLLIVLEEDDGGNDTYSITFGMAVLPGAVTITSQLSSRDDPMVVHFDIGVQGNDIADVATPRVVEVLVDFGAVAHTATFFVFVNGDSDGSVTVSEIMPNGAVSALGTLSGTGGNWNDEANLTSSSRSGLVRLRLTASTAVGMQFQYGLFFGADVSVPAQTTITLTGNLAAGHERFHRVGVNFGPNNTAYGMTMLSATTTGSLDFTMVDVNELAVNGPTQGMFFSPNILTATHMGAQEFVFVLAESSGTAPATYTVTIQVALQASALTNLGTQLKTGPQPFSVLFNIAAEGTDTLTAAGTVTREFSADFGPTTHAAYVWLIGSGSVSGQVELFDISGASPVSIGLVQWTGANEDSANFLIAARTGVVRMRVVVTGSAAGDFDWSAVFDRTVNIFVPGSGGGKKKDDGGCSTGHSGSGVLALLAVLATLAAGMRLRRA